MCTNYFLPQNDKHCPTFPKSDGCEETKNSALKPVDDVRQLFGAKINPASLLSLGDTSISILSSVGTANGKTIGLTREPKHIEYNQICDTLNMDNFLPTSVSLIKDTTGNQSSTKTNSKLSEGFLMNDDSEYKSLMRENLLLLDGDKIHYQEIEDDTKIENQPCSDDVEVKKGVPSEDTKKAFISQKRRNRTNGKKGRIKKKLKRRRLNGDKHSHKTISGKVLPEHHPKTTTEAKINKIVYNEFVNNMNQSESTDSCTEIKSVTYLKDEKNDKRKRRKKSPNSPYKIGTSRYYGVCRNKYGVHKKWVAKCAMKYIGYFPTEEEAASAVDKKLDEMDVDSRFRNMGGNELALGIMTKLTGKPSNWRRPAAIKRKLGEFEDLTAEMNELPHRKIANNTKSPKVLNKTLNYNEVHQNLGKSSKTPLDISNLQEIEPEIPKFPKLELSTTKDSTYNIYKPNVPFTIAPMMSNRQVNIPSICNDNFAKVGRYRGKQQHSTEIPSNLLKQVQFNQNVSNMVDPVQILLLWKSKGFLIAKEYVTALRMLDGRYGEVNSWSTKGLLLMGDINTLKATLREDELI